MKKIAVTDITLKSLSNEKGISLLFREKTAIAACADSLGANAVELAPIENPREDQIIIKTIAQGIQGCVLALPVGFSASEVDLAWDCIKEAKNPRLQIELPVSTVQMEYTFHMKSDKMLEKIKELCCRAKAHCQSVEFCAVDATRADKEFLINAAKAAAESGAEIITLCDTAGISLPDELFSLVSEIKQATDISVYVQPSDKLGMGVACAISAINAGADGIKCAMAGEASLSMGRFSDAITARGSAIKAEISLKNTKIHAGIKEMLQSINHESYSTTEADQKDILLDSDSTLVQVTASAKALGYDLSDEDCGKVYKALLHVCEKKGAVGAKEFEALIASSAMQAPSTYHLESYTTSCGNLSSSMSQITLTCGDERLCGVSTGDGPIDSAFRAIEQCIGHHYELDDFQIQAVTEGKEALGSAVVRLRNNGRLYSGNGISTDIIAASVRAYINALNKIVYEEE